jgi:hypothetical protein
MSTKPGKAAAAKEAVKKARSDGPGLAREKSEPVKKKPSPSVSERSDTFKFGHIGGHDLLRRHYVSRLSKKDAITILSTGPGGKKVANLLVA